MRIARRMLCLGLCLMMTLMTTLTPHASSASSSATTLLPPCPPGTTTSSATCTVTACINEQSIYKTPDAGKNMVNQIFTIINKIILKIETTFYKGIVGSATFQKIISMAFIMYITVYGVMITFGLASYRSGEVASRLIKIAIVYAMTAPTGWTFFSAWIQHPIIGGINDLITDLANAGAGASGGSGSCVTQGTFSGNAITTSGGTAGGAGSLVVSLQLAPMAMLFGPMTCVFSSQFMASIQALLTTGPYGWLLALLLVWGLVEFIFMLIGAIITYVKAIIGLTFLFGLAPIFMAFYLFEKTRALTQGWLAMAVQFAIQPVMLFAFLAFYASIIGASLGRIFMDASGNPKDVCYVPWYNLPGLVSLYWFQFKNASGAAGGEYYSTDSATGSPFGAPLPPPAQILDILYFVVLSSLGKGFARTIDEISSLMSGGGGSASVTMRGEEVGSWFKQNVTGGIGPQEVLSKAVSGASSGVGGIFTRLNSLGSGLGKGLNPFGSSDGTMPRPEIGGGPLDVLSGEDDDGEEE